MNNNEYMLDIIYFNEIVKGIKNMKSDLVCVYGNTLIGTDNTMANLKIYRMDMSIPLIPVCIITKELSSEFYANIIDTIVVFNIEECKIYCPNNKSYVDDKNVMLDKNITLNMIKRYESLMKTINDQNIKFIDYGNITDDQYFQYIKSLKAADGCKLYTPFGDDTYGMYLFKGAIPINKADKVFMNIFDQGETFITRFTILKRKINPIDVYFRYIKLKVMV